MTKLNIDGYGTVKVGRGFLDLAEEAQAERIDSIVSHLEKKKRRDALAEQAGGGTIADVLRVAVGQGAAFGAGDEAVAAFRSLVSDKSYDQLLEEERAAVDKFREENPGTALALELGGSLVAGGGTGVLAKGFLKGGNLALRSGALGAAEGAAAGFGQGEGGVQNRLTSAATGGAFGGAVGAAVPAVVGGLRTAQARSAAPQDNALNEIARAADDADVTMPGLATRARDLSDASGGQSGLVDALDVPGARLARGLTAKPGPQTQQADEFFRNRNVAQRRRLGNTVDELLDTTADLTEFDGDVVAQRARDATPLYDRSMPQAIEETTDLQRVLNRGVVQRARKKARDFMPGGTKPILAGDITVQDLHAIQQALSDVGRKGGMKGATALQARTDLMDILRKQSPDFGRATDIWADQSALLTASDIGSRIFKTNVSELRSAVSGMSDSELSAFRVGVRDAILDTMDRAVWNADLAKRIFKNERMAKQLRLAWPDQQSWEQFVRQINAETLMRRQQQVVTGGSPTARIQQDIADRLSLNPYDFLGLLQGEIGSVSRAGQALGDVFRQTLGAKTDADLANRLFTNNLDEQLRTIMDASRQRAAQTQRLQGTPRVVGGTAGATGAAGGLLVNRDDGLDPEIRGILSR